MDTIFFSGLSQDLKCKSSIYFKNEDIFFKKVSFERIVEHGSVFSLLIFDIGWCILSGEKKQLIFKKNLI